METGSKVQEIVLLISSLVLVRFQKICLQPVSPQQALNRQVLLNKVRPPETFSQNVLKKKVSQGKRATYQNFHCSCVNVSWEHCELHRLLQRDCAEFQMFLHIYILLDERGVLAVIGLFWRCKSREIFGKHWHGAWLGHFDSFHSCFG